MRKVKFNILDEVQIIPLEEQKGTVINTLIDNNDIRYYIRYFVGGELRETYFYERELSTEIKIKEKKIGFKA